GLFADSSFTEVEVTWAVYQDIVNAYRTADRNEGKKLLRTVIDALTTNLPTELVELKRLGRTLKRRAADVLAFFTRPGTSNGPTEAINGRLEHLRGSALGFRNSTRCSARCLLGSGGYRPVLHPQRRRAGFVCGTPPLCVGLVAAGSHGPHAHTGRCRRIDNGPCAEGLSDQRPKSLENSPFFFGFSAGVSSSTGAACSESASEGADSPAVSSVALGAESVLPAASPETDGSGVPAGSACSGTFSRRSSETGLSAEP